jgi:hypothetical protein
VTSYGFKDLEVGNVHVFHLYEMTTTLIKLSLSDQQPINARNSIIQIYFDACMAKLIENGCRLSATIGASPKIAPLSNTKGATKSGGSAASRQLCDRLSSAVNLSSIVHQSEIEHPTETIRHRQFSKTQALAPKQSRVAGKSSPACCRTW